MKKYKIYENELKKASVKTSKMVTDPELIAEYRKLLANNEALPKGVTTVKTQVVEYEFSKQKISYVDDFYVDKSDDEIETSMAIRALYYQKLTANILTFFFIMFVISFLVAVGLYFNFIQL